MCCYELSATSSHSRDFSSLSLIIVEPKFAACLEDCKSMRIALKRSSLAWKLKEELIRKRKLTTAPRSELPGVMAAEWRGIKMAMSMQISKSISLWPVLIVLLIGNCFCAPESLGRWLK